ncbi:MAG: zinc-dependent metalloprotease [Chloroflexota bacterium]|nr:zinc-dependent metalloprotease [Chloroflexota bacterium]
MSVVSGGLAARWLGTGVMLGAAAGATWIAGRVLEDRVSRDAASNPRLLNWEWARRIAVKVAQNSQTKPWGTVEERDRASRDYADHVARSVELVSAYTGIDLPAARTQVYIFDRVQWVDANLAQFALMFAPLDEAYAATLARVRGATTVGAFGQAMLSGQMGVLLGYLGQRVLGQYDLSLLGREPVTEGRLYFVEPNMASLERRYHLPADQFRAWIALHEVTHAFEFEAHPWVREYMNDLLTTYLRSLSEDLFGNRPGGALSTFATRIKDNFFESGHMLEMMMSREQRGAFQKLQALMALMEGYSNHVMQQVGTRHLKDHDVLRSTFESRARNRGAGERLFIKLTGLDVKLEQYALGERFCQHVVDARGIAFLNRVWEGEPRLPTLEEIHEPSRWVARQQAVPA